MAGNVFRMEDDHVFSRALEFNVEDRKEKR